MQVLIKMKNIVFFCFQMQMEAAGGIATWKVLIMKKWGVVKYGKEWVLQL